MPKEVSVSITTVISILAALLAASVWISGRFEDANKSLANAEARIIERLAQLDLTNARRDGQFQALMDRVTLIDARQAWLYRKVLGREVAPGWPTERADSEQHKGE